MNSCAMNGLLPAQLKKTFGPSLLVPNSRTNLWDETPVGPNTNFGWKCGLSLKVLCAEQCFRLAHKHAMSSRDQQGMMPSPLGFLLGTEESDEKETVVTFTTFDPGTMSPNGKLIPSSRIPDSIIAAVHFRPNTPSDLNSVHDLVQDCFVGMIQHFNHLSSAYSHLHSSQAWQFRFMCLHDGQSLMEDGIAQLHICCMAVSVAPAAEALPIKAVPIIPTALAKSLSGPLMSYQSASRTGFLTMNQSRKLLLVLDSEPKLSQLPVIGIWVSGVASIRHYVVWLACLRFLYCQNVNDRLLTSTGYFIILLYSSSSAKPKFYKCKIHDLNNFRFEIQSAQHFIPNYTLSDATPEIKFQLSDTPPNQSSDVAFQRALEFCDLQVRDQAKQLPVDPPPVQSRNETKSINTRSPLHSLNSQPPRKKFSNAKETRASSQNAIIGSPSPSPVIRPTMRQDVKTIAPSVPELSLCETGDATAAQVAALSTGLMNTMFRYNSISPQHNGSSPSLRSRKSCSPIVKDRHSVSLNTAVAHDGHRGHPHDVASRNAKNSPLSASCRTPDQPFPSPRTGNSPALTPHHNPATDDVFLSSDVNSQRVQSPSGPDSTQHSQSSAQRFDQHSLPAVTQHLPRSPSLVTQQISMTPPFMKQPAVDLYVLLQQKDEQISQLQAYVELLQQQQHHRTSTSCLATVTVATQTTCSETDHVTSSGVQTDAVMSDYVKTDLVDCGVNTTAGLVQDYMQGGDPEVSQVSEAIFRQDSSERCSGANDSAHNRANDSAHNRANDLTHNTTSWGSCSLKLDSSAVDRDTEESSLTPRMFDLPGLEDSEGSQSANKELWNHGSPMLGESASTYMQASENKMGNTTREKQIQADIINDDSEFVENLLKQVQHMLYDANLETQSTVSSSESDMTTSRPPKHNRRSTRQKRKRGLPAPLIPHLTYLSQLREHGILRADETSMFTGSASASELSIHANAIALKYLSDDQLNKIAAVSATSASNIHSPFKNPSVDVTTNATMFMPGMSMISPCNMSLATKKYMKKYGLIPVKDGEEEEDVSDEDACSEEQGLPEMSRTKEEKPAEEHLNRNSPAGKRRELPECERKPCSAGNENKVGNTDHSWSQFEQNLGETVNMLVPFLKDLEANKQRSPSAATNNDVHDGCGDPRSSSRASKPSSDGSILLKSSKDFSGHGSLKHVSYQRPISDKERGRSNSVDRVLSSQLLDVFARKHSRMTSLPRMPFDNRRYVQSPSRAVDRSSTNTD